MALAALWGSTGIGGATATPSGVSQPVVLVRQPERLLEPVVLSSRYLVWESSGGEESTVVPSLLQRDLRSQKVRTLARGAVSHYGLASTTGWVVYSSAAGSTLVAVRHDGSGTVTLTRQLVAPIASRGESVAWAEQDRRSQRVFVRDMATGKQWLAAQLPRCVGARCYRIDGVTLAERGVVFVRGAIGSQPSVVVRRAFTDPRPTSLSIPHDPQPDLAPSSAGALYYAFGRGWYRWDFGSSRPRLTRFKGFQQTPVLAYEGGDWFVRVVDGCRAGLRLIRADGGSSVIVSAGQVLALARLAATDCADLLELSLSGTRAVTAWVVRPESADPDEVAAGLVLSQPYR